MYWFKHTLSNKKKMLKPIITEDHGSKIVNSKTSLVAYIHLIKLKIPRTAKSLMHIS